jgi:hypothetical protein
MDFVDASSWADFVVLFCVFHAHAPISELSLDDFFSSVLGEIWVGVGGCIALEAMGEGPLEFREDTAATSLWLSVYSQNMQPSAYPWYSASRRCRRCSLNSPSNVAIPIETPATVASAIGNIRPAIALACSQSDVDLSERVNRISWVVSQCWFAARNKAGPPRTFLARERVSLSFDASSYRGPSAPNPTAHSTVTNDMLTGPNVQMATQGLRPGLG